MMVDADIPQRVLLLVDHIHRRRGFAMAVATLGVASRQRGHQPLHQRQLHAADIGFASRLQYLPPLEPVALHAELLAGDGAGPGQAALAGPAGGAPATVDDRALAQLHARIGAPQPLEHFAGRTELAQEAQAIDAQVRIDLRLGRHRAHTCRRVGQQLAHGRHGGGGGDTDLPGARAAGDDGKGHGRALWTGRTLGRCRGANVQAAPCFIPAARH